jgi:hypothetical protein
MNDNLQILSRSEEEAEERDVPSPQRWTQRPGHWRFNPAINSCSVMKNNFLKSSLMHSPASSTTIERAGARRSRRGPSVVEVIREPQSLLEACFVGGD